MVVGQGDGLPGAFAHHVVGGELEHHHECQQVTLSGGHTAGTRGVHGQHHAAERHQRPSVDGAARALPEHGSCHGQQDHGLQRPDDHRVGCARTPHGKDEEHQVDAEQEAAQHRTPDVLAAEATSRSEEHDRVEQGRHGQAPEHEGDLVHRNLLDDARTERHEADGTDRRCTAPRRLNLHWFTLAPQWRRDVVGGPPIVGRSQTWNGPGSAGAPTAADRLVLSGLEGGSQTHRPCTQDAS